MTTEQRTNVNSREASDGARQDSGMESTDLGERSLGQRVRAGTDAYRVVGTPVLPGVNASTRVTAVSTPEGVNP